MTNQRLPVKHFAKMEQGDLPWYNPSMRIRKLLNLLGMALLLSGLLTTQEAWAWVCDGRICSTSTACCCLVPEGRQDARCNVPRVQQSAPDTCAAGCECARVSLSTHSEPATVKVAGIPSFLAAVALLPPPGDFLLAPPARTAYRIETRGPPVLDRTCLPLGLRAPPAA